MKMVVKATCAAFVLVTISAAATVALEALAQKERDTAAETIKRKEAGIQLASNDRSYDGEMLRFNKMAVNYKVKIDELHGKLSDTGDISGGMAKLLRNINDADGSLHKLSQDQKDTLIAYQTEVDNANQAVVRLTAAKIASAEIDAGLDQYSADMQSYQDRIDNPTMSEAQLGLLRFQEQMQRDLLAVGQQYGETSWEYVDAKDRMDAANNDATSTKDLAEVARDVAKGQRDAIEDGNATK